MAVFGVQIGEINQDVKDYFNNMKKVLDTDFFGMPIFEAEIKHIKEIKTYILAITPRFPNISIIGFIYIMGALMISNFSYNWGYFPGLIFIMLGLLWSKYFYIFFVYKGFKKKFKNNKITLLNNNNLISMMCYSKM